MHSSAPVFRRAASADIAQMSRIRLSVHENRLRDPARVTQQMYEDFLERDGRGWVAQIDGVTVAFSYANRLDGSIWALFVDPEHEGMGLAKHLLELATAWLFELGFAQVTLSTGAGTRAEAFYVRQGWTRQASPADEVAFTLDRGGVDGFPVNATQHPR
ncbi:GNAT family N-acetyltransferase [Massilia sp. HP4]|uniref:GNAT family N-acetyltransferase n=1 Tax=Massilia sp. HP4 TaxID=2562316 RepID=UPI0010C1249D|nr:GNAT family N-acetyltransferase [Massilia sp. HP4]